MDYRPEKGPHFWGPSFLFFHSILLRFHTMLITKTSSFSICFFGRASFRHLNDPFWIHAIAHTNPSSVHTIQQHRRFERFFHTSPSLKKSRQSW